MANRVSWWCSDKASQMFGVREQHKKGNGVLLSIYRSALSDFSVAPFPNMSLITRSQPENRDFAVWGKNKIQVEWKFKSWKFKSVGLSKVIELWFFSGSWKFTTTLHQLLTYFLLANIKSILECYWWLCASCDTRLSYAASCNVSVQPYRGQLLCDVSLFSNLDLIVCGLHLHYNVHLSVTQCNWQCWISSSTSWLSRDVTCCVLWTLLWQKLCESSDSEPNH